MSKKQALFTVLLTLFAASAFATTATAPTSLSDVVNGMDFSELKNAMYLLFGSLALAALITLGGSILLSKLGWRR